MYSLVLRVFHDLMLFIFFNALCKDNRNGMSSSHINDGIPPNHTFLDFVSVFEHKGGFDQHISFIFLAFIEKIKFLILELKITRKVKAQLTLSYLCRSWRFPSFLVQFVPRQNVLLVFKYFWKTVTISPHDCINPLFRFFQVFFLFFEVCLLLFARNIILSDANQNNNLIVKNKHLHSALQMCHFAR